MKCKYIKYPGRFRSFWAIKGPDFAIGYTKNKLKVYSLTLYREPLKNVKVSLWKFDSENYTEKFGTLKLTLKNNIKEGSTENYTETIPLLFRNARHH